MGFERKKMSRVSELICIELEPMGRGKKYRICVAKIRFFPLSLSVSLGFFLGAVFAYINGLNTEQQFLIKIAEDQRRKQTYKANLITSFA